MNKIALSIIIAGALTAAAIIYVNHQKTAPVPAPVATTTPQQTEQPPPEPAPAPQPTAQPTVAVSTPAPAPAAAVAPVETNTTADAPTNSIRKSVDALLSAKSGAEKHNLFVQLAKDGQLDAAIEELKQRAAANPNDAQIPTTLGEALLNKVRAMRESGITDPTDLGIYALQADQQFNAALKIDPKNWEANFIKAATTFYWPPDAQRDANAAQTLASLIDQQETLPSRPEFAQTYAALVKQYQKMGKMDEAAATLNLGLQKFPSDPTLQQMAAGK